MPLIYNIYYMEPNTFSVEITYKTTSNLTLLADLLRIAENTSTDESISGGILINTTINKKTSNLNKLADRLAAAQRIQEQ